MVEENVLQELGLSEKQAKIYLACLELGTSSVQKIAKKAEIKRPTAYLVLESLIERGLVSEIRKATTTLYSSEEPKKILANLRQKIKDFEEILPVFEAKFTRKEKPKITFYEGKKALWDIYLHKIFPAQIIYFYGTSIKKLNEKFPELLNTWEKNWWPKKEKDPKSKVLEIVSNEAEDIKYAQSAKSKREIRVLPKDKKFLADSAIADNKVFIFSLDHLFCVIIESEDIAKSYMALVEMVWQAAEKV